MEDKRETDFERAEKTLLAYSWLGAISALLVIGYCIRCLI